MILGERGVIIYRWSLLGGLQISGSTEEAWPCVWVPTLELRVQVDRTIDRGTEPCRIESVETHSMWSKSSPVDLSAANNLYMKTIVWMNSSMKTLSSAIIYILWLSFFSLDCFSFLFFIVLTNLICQANHLSSS